MHQIPSGVVAEGDALELFRVNGSSLSVPLLTAVQSVKWIENHGDKVVWMDRCIERIGRQFEKAKAEVEHCEPDEYDEKVKAEEKLFRLIGKEKAKRFKLVIDSLRAYDGKVFTEELFTKINTAQAMKAFMELYACTDPTQATSALMVAEVIRTKDAMGRK